MENQLKNRIDFVLFVDVQDGNPNGDPDAGNLPRIDAETGEGLITDVCLKRKVRNYVQIKKGTCPGYDIFIKEKAILNRQIAAAYDDGTVAAAAKSGSDKGEAAARAFMCKKFYDVRAFGAVMTTNANSKSNTDGTDKKDNKKSKKAGQVRGPIQLTFARSVEPIVSMEHTITRVAVTTEREAEKQGGDNRTMGRKSTVPYGLYRCHGFISANLANQTGFSAEDLELFWDALRNMFDCDRSAARGLMSTQKLIVFRHNSELGNAPANKLFDLVRVEKTTDGVARSFADYKITVDTDGIPEGVTMEELI